MTEKQRIINLLAQKKWRAKNKNYQKLWRKKNPEKIKIYSIRGQRKKNKQAKLYYKLNKIKINKKHREYYLLDKEKISKKHQQYYKKNKIKEKLRHKKYYLKNKIKIKKWQKRYYQKIEVKKRIKIYRDKNRESVRIHQQRHKLKRKNIIGKFTLIEWKNLKKQYNYICPCCKTKAPIIKLTIDHIVPVSKKGTNYIYNIHPLCLSCNVKKGIKIIKYKYKNMFKIDLFDADANLATPALNTRALRAQIKLDEADLWVFYQEIK